MLNFVSNFKQKIKEGKTIAIFSEAGCPGVADPGAVIVKLAHEKGIQVIPLVGPSSILLAMMASGMNGQSFTFNGYLPIDKGEKKSALKNLEKFSYNVIIANLHEIYNFYSHAYKTECTNLNDNYIKILKVIFPVLPHFASECLSDLTIEEIKWPAVNKDYLKNSNYKIVVQINGKKRLLFESNEDLDETNLVNKLREIKEIKKYMEKKDIFKTIFIKNKLINLIIK